MASSLKVNACILIINIKYFYENTKYKLNNLSKITYKFITIVPNDMYSCYIISYPIYRFVHKYDSYDSYLRFFRLLLYIITDKKYIFVIVITPIKNLY